MTYNVHGCVGIDRRLDPARIADVIAACDADVVALQELDVERARSGSVDQPRELAQRLGMHLAFCSARDCDGGGRYGNAVLSRHPVESMRDACLPRLAERCEPRAAQWVRVHAPGLALNVLNTHLGLDPRERLQQADTMLGADWLDAARTTGATVLCGDLNLRPRSIAYGRLTQAMRDAQRACAGSRARSTFPSLFPVLQLDHVLVSPELAVQRCEVVRDLRTRIASDHLPVVVDLALREV